jgi:hypothetical protein
MSKGIIRGERVKMSRRVVRAITKCDNCPTEALESFIMGEPPREVNYCSVECLKEIYFRLGLTEKDVMNELEEYKSQLESWSDKGRKTKHSEIRSKSLVEKSLEEKRHLED